MNPQEPTSLADQPAVHNPLSVMEPGERVIFEIKRHPIGMLGIYTIAGGILVILAVLALVVVPNMVGGDNKGQTMALGGLVFFVLAGLSLGFVFISNVVYWGNRWILTSDSLTQVSQTGLFHKQSSQLSLENLEDVTVEKNGILASMLNFGVLRAETAGERSKFIFLYCPNPHYYAQKILAAREVFDQTRHDQAPPRPPAAQETAYQPPAPPSQQAQTPAYPAEQSIPTPDPNYQPPDVNIPPPVHPDDQPDISGRQF